MLELELFSTIYGKACNLINNSISVEKFKGYIHPTLINWILKLYSANILGSDAPFSFLQWQNIKYKQCTPGGYVLAIIFYIHILHFPEDAQNSWYLAQQELCQELPKMANTTV